MVKKLTRRQLDEIARQKRLMREVVSIPGQFPRRISANALALSIDIIIE